MATLRLENVVKDYAGGIRAVDELTLDAAGGELIVLVGPSGCGKTTTLRMIAGLEPATRGKISIAGRPVDHLPPHQRDVAMVLQNPALYPHLSVAGNMAFGLKLRRIGKARIEQRVGEAADVLGIKSLMDRRPGELSGGQLQRVALGRAIVRKPKLFLLDEPLCSLDAALRAQLRREIRHIHDRLGVTMIYVTHDQTEAMTLGQRIAVLYQGRLQQLADGRTLYDRPANRFVAALIGSPAMNFFDGRIERRDGRLLFLANGDGCDNHSIDFTLPIPPSWSSRLRSHVAGPIILGLRGEHIGSAAAGARDAAPRISAKVEAVEPIGPETHVYLNTGRHAFVSRMEADGAPRIGETIEIPVAIEGLHFFDPDTGDAVNEGDSK